MNKLFKSKYKVIIFDTDINFINNIVKTLKSWFSNKIKIEKFTTTNTFLFNVNIENDKKCPYNLAILGPTEGKEFSYMLKKYNPNMKIIQCKDINKLKKETLKTALEQSA